MKWLVGIAALFWAVVIARNISYVAGGPDESGYMNEARMLASGRTHIDITPLHTLHIDNSFSDVFTPLGFDARPNGTIVPVYPPGYPIHLLIAAMIGGWSRAPFFVIPLAAFASLVLTYAIARELGLSRPYSLAAAAILSVHPVFVFHSLVVMSDVLATFWALFAIWIALRKPSWAIAAGAAFAIGVCVRPTNLIVALPLVIALRFRIRPLLYAVLGAIPFGAALMLFNAKTYGDPFTTGYGGAAGLAFGPCLWEQLALLAALLTLPVILGGTLVVLDPLVERWSRALLFVWFAVYVLLYGAWHVCADWTFTRFLLPATPAVIIGAVFVIRDLCARLPWHLPRIVAAIVVVVLVRHSVNEWRPHGVLHIDEDQQVYTGAVQTAQRVTPRDSMIVTGLLSGAFLNYANTLTVRHDAMTPQRFATLRAHTNAPWYAVLSLQEVAMSDFVQRLPGEWVEVARYRDVVVYRLNAPRISSVERTTPRRGKMVEIAKWCASALSADIASSANTI